MLTKKAALRKHLRAQRRALTAPEHAQRSARAAASIARLPAFKSGARVALYLPFDAETDPAMLLRMARQRRIQIFIPVVSDLRHRRLRFERLSARTRRGVYGILVPHAAKRCVDVVGARWFDLVVVPVVGIDAQGRRLGMGAGFYDRAFAYRRLRRQWRGPRLVALCFDCQCANSVHADPWDLTLDAVATESGARDFSTPTQPRGAE